MAKNRKKKVSKVSKQTLISKQHKNMFLKEMESIMNTLGEDNLFQLMPKKIIEMLYLTRYYAIKFNYSNNVKLTKKEKEFIEKLFKYYAEYTHVELPPSDLVINLTTFTTVWSTIVFFVNTMVEEVFPGIDKIRKKLILYTYNPDMIEDGILDINIILYKISLLVSRTDKIHEFRYDNPPERGSGLQGKYHYVDVRFHEAKWKQFIINGESRLAFRLGGYVPGIAFKWHTINTECFIPESPVGKLPIEVYIQVHAIKRFRERIDYYFGKNLFISIYASFDKPIVTKYKDSYLVEFELYNIKLGYFIGDLIDGVYFIKTFLFLTNNGCPEGDRLNKKLKIAKKDKEFMIVDKLSTFMHINRLEANELISIFTDPALSKLLNIRDESKKYGEDVEEKPYQNKIKNYLTFEGEEGYEFEEEVIEHEAITVE